MADGTHRALRYGAAEGAPTAPHAMPRLEKAPTTGPERFWSHRRWGVYLATAAASFVAHYAALPGSLAPDHAFEFHDVDGTLTIPVDLLNEGPPPPPAEPPAAPPPPPEANIPTPTEPDLVGRVTRRKDAGTPAKVDSGVADAGPPDALGDIERAALEDASVASSEDAAAPSGSVRDAVGMIGAAGNVQAGPQNVVLTVNMSAVRKHPEGKRLGPLISAVPQWDDFLVGTGVDPLRDIDWVSINGPALLHTEKDVIVLHYSASDAAVDKGVRVLASKYAQGGAFNVGVPGVRAVRGYGDRAERVFLRPQPHVLAIVPEFYAKTAAQILSKASIPGVLKRSSEAVRLTLVHPHGPMPGVPESVMEIRLWIVPRNEDGGADVYGEGDTAGASESQAAMVALERLIEDQNSIGVQLLTQGLLNHVELQPDGRTVRLHLSVTRDQIEVILAFVAGRLGVSLPPDPDYPPSGGRGPSLQVPGSGR